MRGAGFGCWLERRRCWMQAPGAISKMLVVLVGLPSGTWRIRMRSPIPEMSPSVASRSILQCEPSSVLAEGRYSEVQRGGAVAEVVDLGEGSPANPNLKRHQCCFRFEFVGGVAGAGYAPHSVQGQSHTACATFMVLLHHKIKLEATPAARGNIPFVGKPIGREGYSSFLPVLSFSSGGSSNSTSVTPPSGISTR